MKLDYEYKETQVVFCPKCHRRSQVIDCGRDGDGTMKRKRMCPECRQVWHTVEVLLDE